MSNNFDVVQYVKDQEPLFVPAISDEKIKWEKESQFAIQMLLKPDPKNRNLPGFLAKTAAANPNSLQAAIVNVAAIGITLNPASALAYLVPRDGMVCLDISYKGLLHIAMQSGSIMWGQCKLVYQNDTYRSNGLDKAPLHEYEPFGERGVLVGGYCTVKTRDGDYLTEEMSIADINKIKESSKAKLGPWLNHFNEMARKTIVKRASKYWPKVERLDTAIHYLNENGGEGLADEPQAPQQEVIKDIDNHIIKLVKASGKTTEEFFTWVSKATKKNIVGLNDLTEEEKQFLARKLEGKK